MKSEGRTLTAVRAAQVLRSELFEMAGAASRPSAPTQTLRLVLPRLSESRIRAEWRTASDILRPSVLERLSLQVVFHDGRTRVFGARRDATPDTPTAPQAPTTRDARLRQRDLSFAVEKLLVWAWMTRRGPLTRRWLERTTGCAYPTVASVVKRLGSSVRRHSDRRIELTHVPRTEWARLIGRSADARCTLRFADISAERSDPARLLRRLRDLAPAGVAVGGVAGARHYHPGLDLLGMPRLDLSIHAPTRDVDVDFLRQLDPGLTRIADSGLPATVVLHFVRHQDPLFIANPRGLPWADPVECLLDLHEAGLDAQATELRDALATPASA